MRSAFVKGLPRGGRDLHQLAVVEGLVTGQGLGRGVDLDQPRGVAGGLETRGVGNLLGRALPRPQAATRAFFAKIGGLIRRGLDVHRGNRLDQRVNRRRPGPPPGRWGSSTSSAVGTGPKRGGRESVG